MDAAPDPVDALLATCEWACNVLRVEARLSTDPTTAASILCVARALDPEENPKLAAALREHGPEQDPTPLPPPLSSP